MTDFSVTDVLEIAKISVTLALREAGCHTKSAETAILAARGLKIYTEMKRGAAHGMDQGTAEAGDRKES